MNKSIIAIIPARGGSKGLSRKNIIDLNGKPLIAYTIEAAIKSNIFDKIVVTTDDKEIKEASLKFGAEVIDRPSKLATDTASSLDVIEHALIELKNRKEVYTYFMLLQPTSPLRNETHIREAWEKYNEENASSLVSVVEIEHSPFKMLVEKNGVIAPLTSWKDLTKPRQTLPKCYMPNGAIYICKVNSFLKEKNIFSIPLKIFKMKKEYSVDIDTANDLKIVQRRLNEKN